MAARLDWCIEYQRVTPSSFMAFARNIYTGSVVSKAGWYCGGQKTVTYGLSLVRKVSLPKSEKCNALEFSARSAPLAILAGAASLQDS